MDPLYDIVTCMIMYQKMHNVTNHCVTNVQYLYDSIRMSNVNYKPVAKAVVVFSKDSTGLMRIVTGHLVVMFNGKLIETSYDVLSLPDRVYVDNIKDLKNMFGADYKLASFRECVTNFLEFVKKANIINKNGNPYISSKFHYDKQADFVTAGLLMLKK